MKVNMAINATITKQRPTNYMVREEHKTQTSTGQQEHNQNKAYSELSFFLREIIVKLFDVAICV